MQPMINVFLITAALAAGMLDASRVVAGPAPAPPGGGGQEHVELDPLNDFVFATWGVGDGSQSASQIGCAASADTNSANPRPGENGLPYDYKVTNLLAGSGYYLFLDGDDTNTGNARLTVRFRHRDVVAGSGYETLGHDIFDAHDHNGQFKNCRDGTNSELEAAISATQLAAARAGRYTGSFRAEIRGGLNGTTTSSQDFQVSIDVSNMVRISSMDNIDLGSWTGAGSISAVETFCVYSNNINATYNIFISSPNQDGAGNFFLANGGGAANVPYLLQFNDSVAGGAGTSVGSSALPGTGSNNSIACGGSDNARLTVNVAEADLRGVPADAYGDTLTLVVSPE